MQDLTNKMTWDGSYLEKYHSERMLRKSQRKYKRYTRYKNTEICCAANIYEPCKNVHYCGFEIGKLCFNLHAKYLKFKPVFRMWMTLTFFISYSLYAHIGKLS